MLVRARSLSLSFYLALYLCSRAISLSLSHLPFSRLQPWQEPKRVDLTAAEPGDVLNIGHQGRAPSQWAPSTCARAVSHTVNSLRADLEPTHLNRAVVRTDECAAPVAASDPHEPSMVMLPEKFELFTVKVPPTKLVQPPDALFRQDKLMTPKDRESILQYEKQKRMADLVLGRDRHKQMRLIALMQKRFPNGVLGVESAASDGTVVYAATRLSEQAKGQVAHETRLQKQEWIVRNSRSEPHLGYDFLTSIPKDFVPPPGAPERRLWETKRRVPMDPELTDTRARVFQGAGEKQKPVGLPDEGSHAWGRMSNLRARESENKQWNIITGAEYEICPPKHVDLGRGYSIQELRGREYPSATPSQFRTLHPSLNSGPQPPHVTWGEPGTT